MPINKSARDEAIKNIKKMDPESLEQDDLRDAVSTGSLAVDVGTGIGGFPRGRISEVAGLEQCLSGETKLKFVTRYCSAHPRAGRLRNAKGGTLAKLHELFYAADRALEFYVQSVNAEDRIFLNRIVDVVMTGEKPCFELVTASGKRVVSTGDHRYYTGDRYVPLVDLRPGDRVMVHRGVPYTSDAWRSKPVRHMLYVKHHPVAGPKIVRDRKRGTAYAYHRLLRSRAVVEAHMNGLSLDDYVARLDAGHLDGLRFLARHETVHHRDEDRTNDALSNLVVWSDADHKRHHALAGHNNLRFITVPDEIVAINPAGMYPTYDVKVEAPFHNYVAGGVVVHNCGKTTLCVMAAAAAQRAGQYPVYFDVECALDTLYAERIGFDLKDPEKGLFVTPRTAEDVLRMVEELVKAGADLIVVDSVPGLVTEKELEGDIGEMSPIAIRARVLSSALPKLNNIVKKSRTALVFVNQFRENMQQVSFGRSEKTTGGLALRYFASLRLTLRQIQKSHTKRKVVDILGTEREFPVASKHECETIKSKVASPYRKIEFIIRYDEKTGVYGIDNLLTLIDIAKNQHLIEVKGAWVHYAGKKFNGDTAFYDHLRSAPDDIAAIKAELISTGILPAPKP